MLAASAASTEVSILARQSDQVNFCFFVTFVLNDAVLREVAWRWLVKTNACSFHGAFSAKAKG